MLWKIILWKAECVTLPQAVICWCADKKVWRHCIYWRANLHKAEKMRHFQGTFLEKKITVFTSCIFVWVSPVFYVKCFNWSVWTNAKLGCTQHTKRTYTFRSVLRVMMMIMDLLYDQLRIFSWAELRLRPFYLNIFITCPAPVSWRFSSSFSTERTKSKKW